MSDVNCPYCRAGNDINHDDGYGYCEDQEYEQHCKSCDREFKFTTSISYNYSVECQEGDHEFETTDFEDSYPKTLYDCKNCDYYEFRHKEAK